MWQSEHALDLVEWSSQTGYPDIGQECRNKDQITYKKVDVMLQFSVPRYPFQYMITNHLCNQGSQLFHSGLKDENRLAWIFSLLMQKYDSGYRIHCGFPETRVGVKVKDEKNPVVQGQSSSSAKVRRKVHQDIRGRNKKTLERSGTSRHSEPNLKYLNKNQKAEKPVFKTL